MEILGAYGCPYEDYEGQIIDLRVRLEDKEVVNVGDAISIEMMDGTFTEAEIKIIDPKVAQDFAVVSKKMAEEVSSGKWRMSKKLTQTVKGPCISTIVVLDIPLHEIKTEEEIQARKVREKFQKTICITPFKELHLGDDSIYDHVQDGYTVPDKVIAYLRTTKPFAMSPGIYDHPFKKEVRLLGPYLYTDGKHYWDRDTWKYVINYHVTLPEEFIEYVMSDEGDTFFRGFIDESDSWSDRIKQMKKKQGVLCLLPDNAGEIELDEF